VVEVQILFAPALHTAALITFPYLNLNRCRNHPVVIGNECRTWGGWRWLAHNLKLELKNLATIGSLLPSIHEPEKSVIDPYSIPDLLKHANWLASARPNL